MSWIEGFYIGKALEATVQPLAGTATNNKGTQPTIHFLLERPGTDPEPLAMINQFRRFGVPELQDPVMSR